MLWNDFLRNVILCNFEFSRQKRLNFQILIFGAKIRIYFIIWIFLCHKNDIFFCFYRVSDIWIFARKNYRCWRWFWRENSNVLSFNLIFMPKIIFIRFVWLAFVIYGQKCSKLHLHIFGAKIQIYLAYF